MNTCQVSFRFFSGALISLIAGAIAEPARADHLNFTLYNESSKPITTLYISAARSTNWGNDILGMDILGMGNSTRITFPGQNQNSPCVYDIKAVFSDNSSSTGRFNLCTVDSVDVL